MKRMLKPVVLSGSLLFSAAAGAAEPAAAPPPTPSPAPVMTVTGFQTPESVLHDVENDRYLVSNINGKPLDKDNNGFISVVSPEGKMVTERWIAGGKDKVTLNAPKGSAIHKGVLYVADIDTVRMFDLKTGAPKGDVVIKGATFLNDVAASPDGKIYVTDSGLNPDFSSNGSDAVWVLEGGKATPFFASKDLKGPNGVVVVGKDVWINTFGAPEMARVDGKAGKKDVQVLPNGGLDGVFVGADGTVWVSSWGANSIFKGKVGGKWEPAITGVTAPADFGVDTKRNRVLLPRFMDNKVDIFDVK